jgi:hypothetical protein
MKMKTVTGWLAALAVAAGISSLQAQPTNFVLYNFDSDQVSSTPYGSAWNNWFGGYYQGAVWDSTVDASNSPSSGSLQLTLLCTGSDQYVMNDGGVGAFPLPNYSPINLSLFTNLSFDMRYDVSSAIRTNGNGTLDFGLMRVGSRNAAFAQDWFQNFSIPATNGLGQPNTNWVHINIDLRHVPVDFSDLSSGMLDILIGMDGANFGNNVLKGPQILWFDNIQLSGFVAPIPPPTVGIRKTVPALRLFGGNGIFGRSQLSLVDTTDGWVGANNYPVSYSFTLLGNATSPGNLDTHIQFIPLDWDTSAYQGNSGADFFAANELWLRILSGTGTNTRCVADISWKTNAPFSNPGHTDLTITNAVRAGTWTLTFNNPTNGTLTAPGASPVPFSLSLAAADATNQFSGTVGGSGTTGVGIRIGNMNNNNTANGGVPDDWGSISISGAAGTNFVATFTNANGPLDTNFWNLGNSDGNNLQVLVPTNAPFWITWGIPDAGLTLITSSSVSRSITNWNDVANVNPILTGGIKWALVPSPSLQSSNANFFALAKRTFSNLQVLFPGETNAPGTPTGKVGTPTPLSLGASGGNIQITVNAVDSAFHIAHGSTDTISFTSTDSSGNLPNPAALVDGTVKVNMIFNSTGNFTITATDTTNVAIPPATSSSIEVDP